MASALSGLALAVTGVAAIARHWQVRRLHQQTGPVMLGLLMDLARDTGQLLETSLAAFRPIWPRLGVIQTGDVADLLQIPLRDPARDVLELLRWDLSSLARLESLPSAADSAISDRSRAMANARRQDLAETLASQGRKATPAEVWKLTLLTHDLLDGVDRFDQAGRLAAVTTSISEGERLDQRGEALLSQTLRLADFQPPKFASVIKVALDVRRASSSWRRAAYVPITPSGEADPGRQPRLSDFREPATELLSDCGAFIARLTDVRSELLRTLGADSAAVGNDKAAVEWNEIKQDHARLLIVLRTESAYYELTSQEKYAESLARGQKSLADFPDLKDFRAHIEKLRSGDSSGSTSMPGG